MSQWILKPKISKELLNEFSEYPELVAQLLFNKGFTSKSDVASFFNTSPETILDSAHLGEMQKAVDRINEAISKKQKIFIHGDFDVDGVTSTSILWDYLYKIRNANVLPYIPHKVDEGYGLSKPTFEKFRKEKADLVITVDCGIRDVDLVKAYQNKHFDVIITDHHEPGDEFPAAYAVVHPKHPSSKYKFEKNSGGVIAWKLVRELEKTRLKDVRWEDVPGVDLIAISTVCDIMPLIDENRALVNLGLLAMHESKRKGLQELSNVSKVQLSEIDAYHLGFVLGPRINAAGRLDYAIEAVRLLSTDSNDKARQIAAKLDSLNAERQRLTDELLMQVDSEVAAMEKIPNIIILKGMNWPEGIIGLIAGKITEKYYRPTIVLSENEDGQVTGSARSIPGFNIVEAIEVHKDFLTSHGGHSQAAGLRLDSKDFEAFKVAIEAKSQAIDSEIFKRQLTIDVEVLPEDINFETMELINKFKPFGYANPRPSFLFRELRFITGQKIGRDHTHFKAIFAGESGVTIDVIGFGRADLLDKLSKGAKLDIVGHLDINEFNGNRTIQLSISSTSLD